MTRSHNVTQVELVTTDVECVQNKQNRLRQRLWPESVMHHTFKTTDLISSARLHKGSASLYFPLLPYSTARLFRVAATAGWFSPSVFSLQNITNQGRVLWSRYQSRPISGEYYLMASASLRRLAASLYLFWSL